MRGLVDELCAAAETFCEAEGGGTTYENATNPWVRSVCVAWQEALRACYKLAKAQRGRELDGDRSVQRFNEQGLHPFSTEWGRLMALEALLPGLSDMREKHVIAEEAAEETMTLFVSPRVLRHEAYEAAERERIVRTTLDVIGKLGLDRLHAEAICEELGVDPEALA